MRALLSMTLLNVATWQCIRRPAVGSCVVIVVGLLVWLAVGDLRLRGQIPTESLAAHQYIEGAIHNDPTTMWQSYSPQAKQERGGDRDAFVAYMLAGTHPQRGRLNNYRLVASVPLDDGQTMLFYQIDSHTSTGIQQTIFPVMI